MVDDTRKAIVELEVKEKGSAKAAKELAEIKKGATTLQKELGRMSRESDLDALAKEFGQIAKESGDTGKAVADLTKKLEKLGATQDEIKGVARSFESARSGAADVGGGGGGSTPAAAKFRGAASLIGGGEIVGLVDDLQDLGEGVTALSGDVTKSAGAAVTAGLAFAGATVAIAIIGAALKAFTDQQAKAAATIEGIVDAQRSVDEKINAGATTKELNEERALLIKNLEDEEKRIARLNDQYDRQFKGKGTDNEGIVDTAAVLFSGAEEGLANSINSATTNADSLRIQIDALDGGLESGETAAADMAAAEEELAKQRDKEASEILKQAQLAGQAVAAQQRALGATEEANTERLSSIEDERAAIQAQLSELERSGSTAESVAAEIASLNAQLGNLGKESEFIKNTALSVSKARDAEKKATKDAEEAEKKAIADQERNAERAAAAQENYQDAIKSATDTYGNAIKDIATKRRQGEDDIRIDQGRDLDDIQLKNTQDVTKLIADDWRDARDDALQNAKEIADIRDEGRKSEQEAIRDGDFKQLFLAREALKDRLNEEVKTDQREEQLRKTHLADSRDDLKTSLRQEETARRTASLRSFEDLKLSTSREIQQQAVARSRSLALAQEGFTAELREQAAFNAQRLQMNAATNQQLLQQQPGRIANTRASNQGGIEARMISQAFIK